MLSRQSLLSAATRVFMSIDQSAVN